MDFLFRSTIGNYYANFGLFTFLFIACIIFVFLIGKEYSDTSFYDKKFFLTLFLLGTLFFGFWSYLSSFCRHKKLQ